MLKKSNTHTLKTIITAIVLCITLSSLFCQGNEDNLLLVSDSTKVQSNSFQGLLKTYEKIKIPILKQEKEKRVWILPSLAWNNYDKTQLGLLIGIEKSKQYSFLLAPMYGIGSGNLTGILSGIYSFATPRIQQWKVGLKAKRFSYLLFPEDLSYNIINPSLRLEPKTKLKGKVGLWFSSTYIWQEYLLQGRKTQAFNIHQLGVDYESRKNQLNYYTNFNLELNRQFGMLRWSNDLKLDYKQHKANAFHLRGFLGSFMYNSNAASNIDPPLPIFQLGGMSNTGIYWLQKDYAFQDLYLDRNAQDNFLQKQVAPSDGGFKSVMSVGNTNHFIAAINVKSDILLPSKIKRWFNLQAFANGAITKNKGMEAALYAESGASLLLFNEIIGFHMPFLTTANIQSNQSTVFGIEKREWTQRISFSVDFSKLNKRFIKTL